MKEELAEVMFLPNRDGFLTNLQSLGYARVALTATDDLAVAVDSIRHHADALAPDGIRVFLGPERTLMVEMRAEHVHDDCPSCGSCHDHDRCTLCGVGHPATWDCPPEHGVEQPTAGASV